MKTFVSKMSNCLVRGRKGEQEELFHGSPEHGIQANLDGYAVIPMEDYDALRRAAGVKPEALEFATTISNNAGPVKTEMSGFQTQKTSVQTISVDTRLEALDGAAEMLWVVLANVNGGDWSKQSEEWQDAAARWRDNYFIVRGRVMPRTLPPYIRT